MPLREDLLSPIAGENPAGSNLRYDPVYDQIKEARIEEDNTLPAGAWERQVKRADFKLVAKLAGDALVNRSKDLQLAVWLGEALVRLEGISQLAPVLRMCLELQQKFWEVLYPEVDEGDLGLRVVPLQWAAKRYAALVSTAGLTKHSINLHEYKAARIVGREEDANDNEQQRELRNVAISNGKLTSEALDEAIAGTSESFYVELEESLSSAGEALHELNLYCAERYRDESPSFRALRETLEEVQNLVRSLLRDKRRSKSDSSEALQDEEDVAGEVYANDEKEEGHTTGWASSQGEAEDEEVSPARPKSVTKRQSTNTSQAAAPESWSEALSRIESIVVYLYNQEPGSPLPFALRSSMRFAELRMIVANSQHAELAAPSTELRQLLKGASIAEDWMEVHRRAFTAFGTSCGCGWLDLYRYLWTSCRELGWETQQNAIAAVLQQLLRETPELPGWTLNDDTPVGNAETRRWLAEEIAPLPVVSESQEPERLAPSATPSLTTILATELERPDSSSVEDLFVTAQMLMSEGQIQKAIQLLARDAADQPIGRLRYVRNLQIAEICVQSEHIAVAVPVLQGLVREVEERKLESWEPRSTAARPYELLLQCAPIAKLDTERIFERLCAIDPSIALSIIESTAG